MWPPTARACRSVMRRGSFLIVAALLLHGTCACTLQGYDAGVCKPAQDIQDFMPFCADVVRYTACVPRETSWYPNLTVTLKDDWARSTYGSFIAERSDIENGDLKPTDPTKYNYWYESVTSRFTAMHGADCVEAYRNYMCWLNFPRCDAAGNSVCENMMRACKYPKVMWRCYEPAFYGGRYAEGTQGDQLYDSTGTAEFMRAPFPGLPFRDNEFDDSDEPVTVCTPSIRNSAAALRLAGAAVAAAVLFAGAPLLLLPRA